ncbi:GNAT family N-acetyltransferase [Haloferax sp. Atlit-10N]|uniref:GNAT family N-acetyltransferase n=1 Tax=unclassified Haloferax TaxID=2625095 RepID=UPI000E2803E6|nr:MULTISPECIES: GNAT family N-acetyltransferase [unclassified Haloferax]RDZ45269.1 GNAT family N-acetyltransferase [Haloferax sp. Atlit-16N]RDZ48616.1 GNAT family N-acetyltransferase [Haloferax sp. Atlit-19N]RDZ59678.1 GNAT family N-acetyltransferase [Haloferax sp. Atlit-10N]
MELVEATAENLDALVERWYSLAKAMEVHDELNELVYVDVDQVPADGFRAHFDNEKITDYLIVHEDETIGFVTLREGHHPSRQYSQYLRIVNLAVDEEYRSQGYGTEIVERVKEMARDQGCDHLKVSCEWQNEDARRFYRDTGFRPKQVDFAQPLE